MDIQAPLRKFDHFQQRHKPLAILCATIKKFGDDEAASFATVIAFYAFFAVFPLLLVFMTILGYVLAGDDSLMHSVRQSVLGRFPVIGDTLKNDKLEGSALALTVGILLSLWSSLGVTGALKTALDHVWDVPKRKRANFFTTKLRGLLLLIGLGTLFVIASGASGVVSNGLGGPVLLVFGILISLCVNIVIFLAAFEFMCSQPPESDALLPGAIAAGILATLLQYLGGVYIDHIKNSNSAYGTFAFVLGILAWLQLGSRFTLYSAEFSNVLARKSWPRSLFDDGDGEGDAEGDDGGDDGGSVAAAREASES